MKGLLIVLFLLLSLLCAAKAEGECRRVTSIDPVKVEVDWCNEPVTVSLPAYGYCINTSCKSAHRVHTSQVIRGCCRARESITKTVTVQAKCTNPIRTQNQAIKYTDITSCECFNE